MPVTLNTKKTKVPSAAQARIQVLISYDAETGSAGCDDMAWHVTNELLSQSPKVQAYHVGMCNSTNAVRRQQECLTRLPGAKVVIVLMTKSYLMNKNCIEQIYKTCAEVTTNRQIVMVYLEPVTFAGDFL